VEAGLEAGSIAGLTRPLDSAAAPHDCTRPWPRQAPERFAPVKEVPSLQVALTVLCAWAGLLVEAELDAGSSAGFARSPRASGVPDYCTAPWPRQAPERFAPVKEVPSLQVAVTVPVPCAWLAPMDSNSPAITATGNARYRIRPTPFWCSSRSNTP